MLALLVAALVALRLATDSGPSRAAPSRDEAARTARPEPVDPDQRARALVGRMTRAEKLQLVHGVAICGLPVGDVPGGERSLGGAGYIPGIPRLAIPDLNYTDGAAGVTNCGARPTGQSTVLPSPLARSSSWSPALAAEAGALLGREARRQGFTGLLGGTSELVRDPRWGRSFETPGEDPLLNGTLLAAEVKAVQAQRVVATLKHFAANNQESNRREVSVEVGERALRELHLLPYEIALARSGAASVMCAYNRVRGTHACENARLLRQVLKGEWAFPGQVQSDWGATRSTVASARAGLDEEQFDSRYFGSALADAVATGRVPVARLDDMVRRKLRGLAAVGLLDSPPPAPRAVDHRRGAKIARRLAERSIVLLKNEKRLLPLKRSVRSVAVIGSHADVGVLSGGGSSQVSPVGGPAVPPTCDVEVPGGSRCPVWVGPSPLAAIRRAAPGADVRFVDGTDRAAAVREAARAEVAIVFASEWRREGQDRGTLALPVLRKPEWPRRVDQDRLINAVAAANSSTVVVLETGGPVTTPWISRVPAVLEAWYPGSGGGPAIADVLFGAVNPSGKLTVTFPRRTSDTPTGGAPRPRQRTAAYREGLAVGYRWYDAAAIAPRFAFGHGLSYTSFAYSGLRVRRAGRTLKVRFIVRNRGRRAGAEISQLYLGLPPSAGVPPLRLVGWNRTTLAPGASRQVTLTVPPRRLAVWSVRGRRWTVRSGRYAVAVGASSRDVRARASIRVPGG